MAGPIMNLGAGGARAARGHARDAARHASPWLERGARLGFAANGVVYVTLGLLALRAALPCLAALVPADRGRGGEDESGKTGQRGDSTVDDTCHWMIEPDGCQGL